MGWKVYSLFSVLKYGLYGRIYDVYTLYSGKSYCIIAIQMFSTVKAIWFVYTALIR